MTNLAIDSYYEHNGNLSKNFKITNIPIMIRIPVNPTKSQAKPQKKVAIKKRASENVKTLPRTSELNLPQLKVTKWQGVKLHPSNKLYPDFVINSPLKTGQ